jgi:hypothetical protein
MRMKAVYCLLVLLAGCSSAPKPSPYLYSSQEHMQAAHHWNELASEVAEVVTVRIKEGYISPTEPVYVQSDDRSPFGRAFRSLLITELTRQGIPVSSNPDNPVKIDWTVQPVVHNENRGNWSLPFGLGWLTGGITALVTSPFAGVEPLFNNGSLPHTEIIVTTMISKSGATLSRNAEIYYINDQDRQHYWPRPDTSVAAAPVAQKVYTVVNR